MCVCVCDNGKRGACQLAKESICGLEQAWTPSASSAHYPASAAFTARDRAQSSAVFTLSDLTHACTHAQTHAHSNSPIGAKATTRFYALTLTAAMLFNL